MVNFYPHFSKSLYQFFSLFTHTKSVKISFTFFVLFIKFNAVFAALPVANNDLGGSLIKNGTNGKINITANDTDLDGNPTAPFNIAGQFSVDLDTATAGIQTSVTNASGVWSLNTLTGEISFDPATDYTGTAMLNYLLCDPADITLCDVATVTFLVLEDTDKDGIGNFFDADDDNDGINDNAELNCSTKILNAAASPLSTNILAGSPINKGTAVLNGITGGDINFTADLYNASTAIWVAFSPAVTATNTLSSGGVQFQTSPSAEVATGGQVIYSQVTSTSNPNAAILKNVARYTFDFINPYANFSAQFNGFNYQDALKVKAWYKGVLINPSKYLWTGVSDSIFVEPSNDFVYSNSASKGFSVEGNSFVINITTPVDSVVFYLGKSNNSNSRVTTSISNIKGCLMKTTTSVEDDFNSTMVNVPIQENINTNDLNVPRPILGTTYGFPTPSAGNINPANAIVQLQINSDGTYSFTSDKAGFYTFDVPVLLLDGTALVSKLTIIVAAPLSVDLLKFNAKQDNENIKISWATDNQKDFDHFAVLRSIDAKVFEQISTVKGQGNNYEFTDSYSANNTHFYYQLKMVNYDGSVKFSKVVYVYKNAKNMIKAFPNPAKDIIFFNEKAGLVLQKIDFFKADGQLVLATKPTNGYCNISSLPKGSYILVTTDSNFQKTTQYIVKQ